jgi:probable rRNA maturation factor
MNDDPDSMSLQVAVRIEDPAWPAAIPDAEALCRAAAVAALRARDGGEGELAVVLADDALLRRLNRDYRGLDRPTNVLSFALDEPAAPDEPDSGGPAAGAPSGLPRLLGDVVLARETVLREAGEQGKAAADHLQHLVVHGVLHLLGHDHEADDEAAAMEAAEVAILAGLGVSDPYEAPDSATGPARAAGGAAP